MAKPPKKKPPKKKPATKNIAIDKGLHKRLRKLAADRDGHVGEFTEKFIESGLKRYRA